MSKLKSKLNSHCNSSYMPFPIWNYKRSEIIAISGEIGDLFSMLIVNQHPMSSQQTSRPSQAAVHTQESLPRPSRNYFAVG